MASVRRCNERGPECGFSTANPQRLFLPVNIDPEYRYESVNVASQQSNPSSPLLWMRRLVNVRQQFPVFGTGDMEFLLPDNAKVLCYLRSDEDTTILVVANLEPLLAVRRASTWPSTRAACPWSCSAVRRSP